MPSIGSLPSSSSSSCSSSTVSSSTKSICTPGSCVSTTKCTSRLCLLSCRYPSDCTVVDRLKILQTTSMSTVFKYRRENVNKGIRLRGSSRMIWRCLAQNVSKAETSVSSLRPKKKDYAADRKQRREISVRTVKSASSFTPMPLKTYKGCTPIVGYVSCRVRSPCSA